MNRLSIFSIEMRDIRFILYCYLLSYSSTNAIWEDAVKITRSATNQIQKGFENIVNQTLNLGDRVHRGAFELSKGVINGVKEVVGTPVSLEQLTFHVVTSENPESARQIDFYAPGDIWSKDAKIYVMIHGWKQSIESEWIRNSSRILVTKFPDSQIVQVNWDKPASDFYPFSAFDTESAGNLVGIFVHLLTSDYSVPSENIVLIGHSLGSQIAGFVGKKFLELSGKKLPRIIALDPAGPLFALRPNSKRLNEEDAEVVMVVHTDGGKFGFQDPCGTIDFFPNGGKSQPGCWDIDIGNLSTYTGPVSCDHSRAWQYFVEAVEVNGSFPARKCESYDEFRKNKCNGNLVVAISDLETNERGKFFLKTNDSSPYSEPLDDTNEENSVDSSTSEPE